MKPEVCVIVPVHNAPEVTQRLLSQLNSARNTESTPFSVLIVDDASNPNTSEMVKFECTTYYEDLDWQYLRNPTQQLFTRTVNRGLRAAAPNIPYLVALNTDCDLKEGWLDELVRPVRIDARIGIIGYDGSDGQLVEVKAGDYVTGHCILFRRKMLEQVGVLQETDLGGPGSRAPECPLGQAHIASERILCYRALEAGWKVLRLQKELVIHGEGPSWNRNLGWLASFPREQLWPGRDTL